MTRFHAGVGMILTVALWCGGSGSSHAQTVRPQDCEAARTAEWQSADALLAEIRQNADEFSACIIGRSNGWCTELSAEGRELLRQRNELLDQANRKAEACRHNRADRAEDKSREDVEISDHETLAEIDADWKKQYEAAHGAADGSNSVPETSKSSRTLADRVLDGVSRIHADAMTQFETAMAGVNARHSADERAEDKR